MFTVISSNAAAAELNFLQHFIIPFPLHKNLTRHAVKPLLFAANLRRLARVFAAK